MRLNLARLVLSQSCSVFFCVVSLRLRIISLMVSLSAATSPWASTVIDRVRSPLVTAVATSAMARTCVVRLAASWLTFSVRAFQVPAAPGTLAWPPSWPSTPTSRATVVTWSANVASVSIMLVDRVGQLGDFALGFDRQLALQVAVGDGGHDLGDAADLAGEVAGHEVHVVGQVLPGAGDAFHLGLAAELAFGADFAGHAGHFGGERAELIDHRVDGVLQLEDFALHIDGDLLATGRRWPRPWSRRRCCGPGR